MGQVRRGDAIIFMGYGSVNDLGKVGKRVENRFVDDEVCIHSLNLVQKAILAHRWHIGGVYLELGRMEILSIF